VEGILLDERERTILKLRFGLEDGHRHTLKDVGKKLALTRERIRQIEKGALEKMGLDGQEWRDMGRERFIALIEAVVMANEGIDMRLQRLEERIAALEEMWRAQTI